MPVFRWTSQSPATHARLFEDKVFGWHEWNQHRNAAWRHRVQPLACLREAAGFAWELLLVLVTSVLTGLYHKYLVPLGLPSDSSNAATAPYGMVTFALTLLLVFKTNSSYARWWDGRIIWGEVVNWGRIFPRMYCAYAFAPGAFAPASAPCAASEDPSTGSAYGSARRGVNRNGSLSFSRRCCPTNTAEPCDGHLLASANAPHPSCRAGGSASGGMHGREKPSFGRRSLASCKAEPYNGRLPASASSGHLPASEHPPTHSAGGSPNYRVHGLGPPPFARHSVASSTADMQPYSCPLPASEHPFTFCADGSARGEPHGSGPLHVRQQSFAPGTTELYSCPLPVSEHPPTFSEDGSARRGVYGHGMLQVGRQSCASGMAEPASVHSPATGNNSPDGSTRDGVAYVEALHGLQGDELHGNEYTNMDKPHAMQRVRGVHGLHEPGLPDIEELHGDEAPHVGVLRALLRWTAAAPHVLRGHLREATAPTAEQEAAHLLSPSELEYLRLSWTNKPQGVAFVISQLLIHGLPHLQPFQQCHLQDSLSRYIDMLGGCERIQRTPIPFVYVRHTSRFLLTYVTLSPLLLWPAVGWGTLIVAPLVAFLLIGIENAGVQIEEPFRILPLDALCKGIEAGVGDMGSAVLPPAPPGVQWPTVWRTPAAPAPPQQ